VKHVVCIVIHCVMPDLCRRVQDLLSSGLLRSYQRLGTTYLSLLKIGPINVPKRRYLPANQCQRNISEERRSRVVHSVLQIISP
jgi:hypothetical protein